MVGNWVGEASDGTELLEGSKFESLFGDMRPHWHLLKDVVLVLDGGHVMMRLVQLRLHSRVSL